MSRGRLAPPKLDDRTWQDIVNEARALIPTYAEDWTDHNPSDLGMALIELFAWLVEGMIYRLNRVPEKNYIAFLNLLGITRDPATPASTFLTYQASGKNPVQVKKGSQAATQQTESEEAIVFETDQDLTVLPINLTRALYIKTRANNVDNQYEYKDVTADLVGSPLSGMAEVIPPAQHIIIILGFDASSAEKISLSCRFSKPIKTDNIEIDWLYSKASDSPPNWDPIQSANINDGTESFRKNGLVSFSLPGDWASQNPQDWSDKSVVPSSDPIDESRFWIGLKISNSHEKEERRIDLKHVLFNSVSATNAVSIAKPELLGVSNGDPFQFFELKNRPLFKRLGTRAPYDHLTIEVRKPRLGGDFEDWEKWICRDDFPEGEDNCFRLDPITGTINFGNYHPTTSDEGHGTIPPPGSEIQAKTYRYVAGGGRGNVPPDKIKFIRTPQAGLASVTNYGQATGGSDEEAAEDAKRWASETLRNRDRAVTAEDYEYLAREATTDVKIVRCLKPRISSDGTPFRFGGLCRDPGHINVIIIPAPFSDEPEADPTPEPSKELIEEVSDFLETRRVMTDTLHVEGPRYLPIKVTATVKIWKQAIDDGLVESEEKYKTVLLGKIARVLHPVLGGPEGQGWAVGQDILLANLLEVIQPDPSIGFISDPEIVAVPPPAGTDKPFANTDASAWVQLADYEIVCNGTKDEDIVVVQED